MVIYDENADVAFSRMEIENFGPFLGHQLASRKINGVVEKEEREAKNEEGLSNWLQCHSKQQIEISLTVSRKGSVSIKPIFI